jgi:hypothetical protein
MHTAVDCPAHEPRGLEHTYVARHRGQRHGKRFCKISDHRRLLGESREQRAPRAIAKRMEYGIQTIVS